MMMILQELVRRIATVTGELRWTRFLLQRLNALQPGYEACV